MKREIQYFFSDLLYLQWNAFYIALMDFLQQIFRGGGGVGGGLLYFEVWTQRADCIASVFPYVS